MSSTLPAPQPFFSYGRLFPSLKPPELTALEGDFQAALLGPAWFQTMSRVSLRFGGLPDWYGKRFTARGEGINLIQSNGSLATTMPMQVRIEASRLDGKPAAVVHYDRKARLPWRYVLDELRVMEDSTLLGMTLLDVSGLRRLALPFLLHRVSP